MNIFKFTTNVVMTILFFTTNVVFAGLPPTTTKGSGDANPVTTFRIDAPNIPITHSGTTATIGTIPVAGGGTGSTASLNNNRVMQSSGGSIVEAALITGSRLLVSDSNGIPTHSTVTSTEAGYLSGVTGGIQTQLDAKQARSTLTTKGDLYVATASATTARQGVGTNGQSIIADSAATNGIRYKTPLVDNFIKNGDAESTSPIVTYADAAGTRPVDGTGGAPSVTTSISSTAPLADTNSFLLTKDAVNRQGQGWSIPFTIPNSMKAKVAQIELDYIVNSGTFAAGSSSSDGDLIVYIYDVTNSTLIEPSSIKFLSSATATSDRIVTNFQTSATGTSYNLILHVASTSASAWELKTDNIQVKPSQYVYGTPITDWVAYTPAGTWSTNTTWTGFWRRVGQDMEVKFQASLSGAPSGNFTANIPTGYTIDTTKLLSTGTQEEIGFGRIADSGAALYHFSLRYNSTVSIIGINLGASGTYVNEPSVVDGTTPITFGASDIVNGYFKVPITGWSSSVQVSDGYDGRQIVFVGLVNSGTHTSTGNWQAAPNFTSIVIDTVASSSTSTNAVTIVSSGKYRISAKADFSINGTGSRGVRITKNGTPINGSSMITPSSAGTFGTAAFISIEADLVAGDLIRLEGYQNSGGNLNWNNGTDAQSFLTVTKLQSPTTISATEVVAASYTMGTAQTLTAAATIKYDTKIVDTHGAWNSATGIFTAPVSGLYEASFQVLSIDATSAMTIALRKNSITVIRASALPFFNTGTTIVNNDSVAISHPITVSLNAGETLDVYNTVGLGVGTIYNTGVDAWVNIKRIK